jgi:hypothetical protein
VRTFIILTSYEQVMEALEAEEDMELEEDTKRNQQEDNDKGLGESNPWLKHHTKWPTRFKGRPLNILAITKKTPSTSVRQVTQGVGHGCHESIDDANYDGDLATYMRK